MTLNGLEMQNEMFTVHEDLLLKNRLSDSKKILSKTNLGEFNITGNSLQHILLRST